MANLGKQSNALMCQCYCNSPNTYRRDNGKRCQTMYTQVIPTDYPKHPCLCLKNDIFKYCISCAKVGTCKTVKKIARQNKPVLIWRCTDYEQKETT